MKKDIKKRCSVCKKKKYIYNLSVCDTVIVMYKIYKCKDNKNCIKK